MPKFVIVAETGADLTKETIDRYNIKTVPMHVSMEGKSLNDGEFPVTDLFESYARTKKLPMTSATNPEEYKDMFEKIHQEDPNAHILHLCYSAVTTATYQNSIIGSEGMGFVTHFDTKGVTGRQGSVIIKVAQYIEKNPDASVDDVIKEAAYWVDRALFAFFPGDLEYLKAGGRVSNSAYLVATLLGLKPLIEILDGALVGTKKYRGTMAKVCKKLVREYLTEHKLEKESFYLVYSAGLDEGLKKEIEAIAAEFGYTNPTWIPTGCVISTHSGPGAFGIGGFEI
ncbi:MAG: DegV family EDD domain-containing protein [Clostridiales bacterium]|nr:DegV family EDD domain-containing protein [Clostridiales bacterium]